MKYSSERLYMYRDIFLFHKIFTSWNISYIWKIKALKTATIYIMHSIYYFANFNSSTLWEQKNITHKMSILDIGLFENKQISAFIQFQVLLSWDEM